MENSTLYLIGPTESILTKRGNRFPNFADYLVESGKNVVYYTSDFYHAEKRFFSKEEIREEAAQLKYKLIVLSVWGYYVNVSPRRVISNFLFSFKLFFKLLFKVKKHDKIFLPSRPVELIYFMALLKRIRGVYICLDIQDVWPDALQIENKRKKKLFYAYCNAYLKPSLKYYDATIHTAPSFKDWLRRYAPEAPSEFIPLGWENKRWGEIDKEQVINMEQINIVCVAQLQYQIDVLPILEVLKDHKQFFLTIVGEDGKGERYSEVMAFIKKHQIDNVKIVGKVKREEMKGYLKDNDIGILPMITPSIPNKIFDYLASQLPIIVLGENDSSDFVKNNLIGWSCQYNSEDLQKILLGLSKNDIIDKSNKVKSIREGYSRDKLHQKLDNLL